MSTRILKLLVILLIPIFVVGVAVRILTTDAYLAFEYSRPSFPPDSYGFTGRQRLELASTNIHYVRGHLPVDALSRQTLDGRPAYNPAEALHMADVRTVFSAVLGASRVAFVLLILLGLFLWRTGEQGVLASALRAGGFFTSGLFAWQTAFDLFHRVFFTAGSWLFFYTDTLIRLFPIKFWFDATVTISLFSLSGGLLLALIGWRGKCLQAH